MAALLACGVLGASGVMLNRNLQRVLQLSVAGK
jgi:hypothetical protein